MDAALNPGMDEGTATRVPLSSAMTIADADVVLICSACAVEMEKAVWMSFVTWSPPTPRTPAHARRPSVHAVKVVEPPDVVRDVVAAHAEDAGARETSVRPCGESGRAAAEIDDERTVALVLRGEDRIRGTCA